MFGPLSHGLKKTSPHSKPRWTIGSQKPISLAWQKLASRAPRWKWRVVVFFEPPSMGKKAPFAGGGGDVGHELQQLLSPMSKIILVPRWYV